MTDERVTPVVNRKRGESLSAEHFAGSAESLSQRVTGELSAAAIGNEWSLVVRALRCPFALPCNEISKRPRVPPEWDDPRLAALRGTTADAEMRPRRLDSNVGDLEHGNLADAKPAADRKPKDDEVLPRGRGAQRLAFQISEHRDQLAACQNLGGIDGAVVLHHGEVPRRRAGLLLTPRLLARALSEYRGFRKMASELGPSSRILGPIFEESLFRRVEILRAANELDRPAKPRRYAVTESVGAKVSRELRLNEADHGLELVP
jgi:hypothetical protein